jgi:hypothetical protein
MLTSCTTAIIDTQVIPKWLEFPSPSLASTQVLLASDGLLGLGEADSGLLPVGGFWFIGLIFIYGFL